MRGPGIGSWRRELALNAWARDPFDGAPAIARAVGISLCSLHTLVGRARKAGDPRAVSRPLGYRRGGSWAAFFLRLKAEGLGPQEIAAVSRRPVKAVRSTLDAYARKAAR